MISTRTYPKASPLASPRAATTNKIQAYSESGYAPHFSREISAALTISTLIHRAGSPNAPNSPNSSDSPNAPNRHHNFTIEISYIILHIFSRSISSVASVLENFTPLWVLVIWSSAALALLDYASIWFMVISFMGLSMARCYQSLLARYKVVALDWENPPLFYPPKFGNLNILSNNPGSLFSRYWLATEK